MTFRDQPIIVDDRHCANPSHAVVEEMDDSISNYVQGNYIHKL